MLAAQSVGRPDHVHEAYERVRAKEQTASAHERDPH
jgi:hypothetical protein